MPADCAHACGPDGVNLRAALRREAVTFGAVERVCFTAAPRGDELMTLGVGETSASVVVDAAGWTCLVNSRAQKRVAAQAPAAALAAAIGVAKLFGRHVLERPVELGEQFSFDTLSLKDATGAPDVSAEIGSLGRVHLLGAGAIGNAFAWVVRAAGWRCVLVVIDDDRYDVPNEETSVMVGLRDVLVRPEKAKLLAGCLDGNRIAASALRERVHAQSAVLGESCDVLVCGVDNVETRRALDSTAAGVVLNGAVGDSRDTAGVVLCTRHGREDWALTDAYPPVLPTESAASRIPAEMAGDECSRIAYEGVSLAAPFAAMAAGALLAARAAHHAMGHRPSSSEFELDLLRLVSRYASRSPQARR